MFIGANVKYNRGYIYGSKNMNGIIVFMNGKNQWNVMFLKSILFLCSFEF